MRPFWLSWDAAVPIKWDGPWWLLSEPPEWIEVGRATYCAAVMAPDVDTAKRLIFGALVLKVALKWRFYAEKPEGWDPFCDRFARAAWMQWPWPVPAVAPTQEAR